MIIKDGLHLELVNRSTGRVIFSAATDELEKSVFDELWATIGNGVWKSTSEVDKTAHYEIRISRVQLG